MALEKFSGRPPGQKRLRWGAAWEKAPRKAMGQMELV
jgi:hypothetical protein